MPLKKKDRNLGRVRSNTSYEKLSFFNIAVMRSLAADLRTWIEENDVYIE